MTATEARKVRIKNAPKRICKCGCGRLARGDGRYYVKGHKPKTLEGRILEKVVVTESGCWEWIGAKGGQGYGSAYVGAGVWRSPHRVMHELRYGPSPSDMHLDHLCRNPPCCNPDHLELVTVRENVVVRSRRASAVAHMAGTCVRGHPTATEACIDKVTGKRRYCRACRRERRAAA